MTIGLQSLKKWVRFAFRKRVIKNFQTDLVPSVYTTTKKCSKIPEGRPDQDNSLK